MTVFVDHARRRDLILEHSFALFAEEGFAGVTYQKIANRCGISRTLIYKYFKDKEEIFMYAIKKATDDMSSVAEKVTRRLDLSPVDKIRRVLHLTIWRLSQNRFFLAVILDYLLIQKQAGADIRRKVRRYTFGMRFFLKRLIQDAIDEGFFIPLDPEKAAGMLFGVLESYVLNLTVIELRDWKECIPLIDCYINERLIEKTSEKDHYQ